MNIKDNSIIILANGTKEQFIKEFRKNHQFAVVTILELDEFKKKYYFDYTKEAIYYVHKHLGVIKDIAEIYLQNLYFIRDHVDVPKVKFLKEIKAELDDKKLLLYDVQFKKYLNGKDVYVYKLSFLDNFYINMIEEIKSIANVHTIEDDTHDTCIKPLYELSNKEREVDFIASEIASLIKRGVPIDNIKIAISNDDYIFSLRRVFKEFHIPIELPSSEVVSCTVLASKFAEYYSSDMTTTLKKLEEHVKSARDREVFKLLLATLNEYYWCDDYMDVFEFIMSDLKKKKLPSKTYKHAVRIVDFLNDSISQDDYVFLLNFNQGIMPINSKDEDYLNDETKRALGLSDSIDLNKKRIAKTRQLISTLTNLIVTYAARDLKGELYISNAYDEKLFQRFTPSMSFEHSEEYNKRILLCAKDENKKYGVTTEILEKLLAHYIDEPYMTFDNTFKGINSQSLKEFLNDKLTLSYSSMDDYYKCSFRYYLDYILHVDKFEDSFATVTGTIFHEVLSKCFIEPFDFEEAWSIAIDSSNFEFKNMENFYLGLLKEELAFIIENLKNQKEYTELDEALYEQKILVPLDDEGNIVFKGFVDKILYKTNEGHSVAAIVDYKTGNPELNLNNVIYGLDMQLPVYAYLLKHFEPLKNASIGGFYLQKIINNEKDIDSKKSALKLQGYSNSNPRILEAVDKTYEESTIIKSLRMTKGKFYSYSKVLDDNQIAKMIEIVEMKIADAVQNILAGNFQIDPKEIDGKNVGCKFCKYSDICFLKNENIVKLEKRKKEEFLGGEEDGLD